MNAGMRCSGECSLLKRLLDQVLQSICCCSASLSSPDLGSGVSPLVGGVPAYLLSCCQAPNAWCTACDPGIPVVLAYMCRLQQRLPVCPAVTAGPSAFPASRSSTRWPSATCSARARGVSAALQQAPGTRCCCQLQFGSVIPFCIVVAVIGFTMARARALAHVGRNTA